MSSPLWWVARLCLYVGWALVSWRLSFSVAFGGYTMILGAILLTRWPNG